VLEYFAVFNTLNAKLNPTCHFLALVEAYHILLVSRIRVKHKFAAAGFIFGQGNC
jgi:hypothetical protein